MLGRFVAYAALGLLLECAWTGLCARLRGDRAATCKTYLVMLPLYGAGGLLLELLPWWPARLAAIYALEASWGLALARWQGACPWRYTGPLALFRGTVSLALLPAWLLLAALFPLVAAAAGGSSGQ